MSPPFLCQGITHNGWTTLLAWAVVLMDLIQETGLDETKLENIRQLHKLKLPTL
jgi:hypothetical protein